MFVEFKGYLTLLISITSLIGFIVLLQSFLSENVQKFLNELVVLSQTFLSAEVDASQRVEGFDLDQLLSGL